jgi:hypothetical protein
LLEDAGFQYRYISSEQLEKGKLDECRLLILPECEALSKKEREAIKAFAQSGGVVAADCFVGTMDTHGSRLKDGGQLDDLFGIHRKNPGKSLIFKTGLRIPCETHERRMAQVYPHRISENRCTALKGTGKKFNGISLSDTITLAGIPPVEDSLDYAKDVTCLAGSDKVKGFAVRKEGKGLGIFLNLRLIAYQSMDPQPNFRYSAKGDSARAVMQAVLDIAGLKPSVTVTHDRKHDVAPNEIFTFTDNLHQSGASVIGIIPNYHYSGCPLPGVKGNRMKIDGQKLSYDSYPAVITFHHGKAVHTIDMLKGKILDNKNKQHVTISTERPVLLARLPYKITGIGVEGKRLPGEKSVISLKLSLKAETKPDNFAPHVIRIEVYSETNPDMRLMTYFVQTDKQGRVDLEQMEIRVLKWKELDSAVSEPLRVSITDVLTKTKAEIKVE